jgi:hypothetical protein
VQERTGREDGRESADEGVDRLQVGVCAGVAQQEDSLNDVEDY